MTSAYFVSNDSYLRWTVGGGAIDAGYPKPVANGWTNIGGTGFENGFDAALDLGKGKLYLFKGGSYLRIDNATNTVESAVSSIADNWPGLADAGFADSIDAAVNLGDGTAYLFRGDQYVGYGIEEDAVTFGPASIAADWGGLADAGLGESLDAAVNWGTGVVYFFRGDQYATYDIAQDAVTATASVSADWGFGGVGFVPVNAAWVRLTGGGGAVPVAPAGQAGLGDCIWYLNSPTFGVKVHIGSEIPRLTWFPEANPAVATDYANEGKNIYEFVVHADGLLRGQPHMRGFRGSFAWLNRNPGNIMASGTDYGEYRGKTNWHGFMIFPTQEAGFAAIGRLLRGPKYSPKTLLAAFEAYAPASDGNNPVQYATDVAAAAGVTPDTTISSLNDDQLLLVQKKIEAIEGTVPGDQLAVDSPDVPAEVRALLA